jgi:acetyltransferase-like isoleucine patch superfamily enzyme
MNCASKLFLFVRIYRAITNRLRYVYYKCLLGSLGPGGAITSDVFIDHPYNVYIGKSVIINQKAVIQASPQAAVTIGNHVRISFGAIILTASLSTGDDFVNRGHEHKPVIIEDNAWIAAGAVILPGVTIGAGSIVAAGAVVTKSVAPNTVVGGVPARVVRELDKNDE